MQSSYLNFYIRLKTQIWSNLTKIAMSRARAERYACSKMTILKRKKRIKPHLQQLYLQTELIILGFLFKRLLSNNICFEFWEWQQRLYFKYLQLLIPQGGDFPEIERAVFVNQLKALN